MRDRYGGGGPSRGTSPPFGSIATRGMSTAVGGNVGVTGNYLVRSGIGIGGFLRYAGGSFDLSTASKQKAGGIQIGAGLRLRF